MYLLMIVTEREREAETQAEGEAGSMHREPDMGFDPGSPGSRPGPKAGAKRLRHPGIPSCLAFAGLTTVTTSVYLARQKQFQVAEPWFSTLRTTGYHPLPLFQPDPGIPLL